MFFVYLHWSLRTQVIESCRAKVYQQKFCQLYYMRQLKKTAEEQLRDLFARHSPPPLEVIIPILEQTGRGEQELVAQFYDTYTSLVERIQEILGLKDKNMKTLAKVGEIVLSFEGRKFQPIGLTEARFSVSLSDCPMCHVGKDVSLNVKGKFCDLICTGMAKAMMDTVLGPQRGTCTWEKALIRGARKCTLVFECKTPR